jgi:myxalamid-type polyketide synthase MxaE and MxaD
MGRTALPPRERWDEALAERQTRAVAGVRGLEGAGVTVRLVSADVADEAAVAALLEQLSAEGWPPIRGVVHAAGVIADRLIADMDGESLRQVLRPKVLGSWRLHEALSSAPLDFFVLFSSLGSLLGQAGQGSYAAANAFLDALAHLRRAQGLAALAVNWGAWEGRGFAATAGGARTLEALAAQGIASFRPEDALDLLGRLLASEVPQAAVMPFDPERFLASGRRVPPLLAELCRTRGGESGTRPLADVQRRLLALDPQDRRAFLETHLQEQLAAVLKVPEARIELRRPMGSLGLESLTALELRKRLETTLGLRLSATIVWNYPTVAALAQHLEARLEGPRESPTRAAPTTAPASEGTTLAALQHLSEEDALRQLLEKRGTGQ